MNKTFKRLVLLPSLYTIAALVVTSIKSNAPFMPTAVAALLICEHVYVWRNKASRSRGEDFRFFYARNANEYLYLVAVSATAFLAIALKDHLNTLLLIFAYGGIFILFRAINGEGLAQTEDLSHRAGELVKVDVDIWRSNKRRLRELLRDKHESPVRTEVLSKIDYSSFLRTDHCKLLIDQLELSQSEEWDTIMESIRSSL